MMMGTRKGQFLSSLPSRAIAALTTSTVVGTYDIKEHRMYHRGERVDAHIVLTRADINVENESTNLVRWHTI